MNSLVLTTGQAGVLAYVSGGMVRRWIDRGDLKAFTIRSRATGPVHRRVLAADLRKFLVRHAVPTDRVDAAIAAGRMVHPPDLPTKSVPRPDAGAFAAAEGG